MRKRNKTRVELRWRTCPGCGSDFETYHWRGDPLCDECEDRHERLPENGVPPIGMFHHEKHRDGDDD